MTPTQRFWGPIGRSAVVLGIAGAIAGLVVGLIAHPATAWFAIFELGCPAAVVGALSGLLYAVVAWCRDKLRR